MCGKLNIMKVNDHAGILRFVGPRNSRDLRCRRFLPVSIIPAILIGLMLAGAFTLPIRAQSMMAGLRLRPQLSESANDALGAGFAKHTLQSGFSLGAGVGQQAFGSTVSHNLALASASIGWICSDVMASNHWYRGNWEFIGELYGGAQTYPNTHYLTGITPLLRYNVITYSRWMPFINGGLGVARTDIGYPDLSGLTQFTPQAGFGTHYFLQKDVALTFEYRFLHLSNGGFTQPNNGVNTQMFFLGLNWFF